MGVLNNEELVEFMNDGWSWRASSGGSGIKRVESLDKENLVQLRDLETGPYILYGWFSPFPNSDISMTFDNTITIVSRKTAGSHLFVLTGLNTKINFLEILVDETVETGFTYTRTDFVLGDMHNILKGGTANQVLITNADGVVEWKDISEILA